MLFNEEIIENNKINIVKIDFIDDPILKIILEMREVESIDKLLSYNENHFHGSILTIYEITCPIEFKQKKENFYKEVIEQEKANIFSEEQQQMSTQIQTTQNYYINNIFQTPLLNYKYPQAIITMMEVAKHILRETTVIVRGLLGELRNEELITFFSQYGEIKNIDIRRGLDGKPLGFVIIKYESANSAHKCILYGNNSFYKRGVISIEPYAVKNVSIDETRSNLYVKHLPNYMTDDVLNMKLRELFERFGPIDNLIVRCDRIFKKRYAIVFFNNFEFANDSLRILNGTDPFNCGSKLYISYAERKIDRAYKLQKLKDENESYDGYSHLNKTKRLYANFKRN